jgi:hypothetical protein
MPVTWRKFHMVKTSIEENRRTQKPNWVDKGTLFVLTVTLVAVVFYTREAHQQTGLIRQSFEVNSRPYLSITHAGFSYPENPGDIFHWTIQVSNLGKTPANATIRAITVYSLTKVPSPQLPAKEHREIVWPGSTVRYWADSEPLTEGQISDMKAGRGWLYVRTLVTYGDYRTATCNTYTLKPLAGEPMRFDETQMGTCDDLSAQGAT